MESILDNTNTGQQNLRSLGSALLSHEDFAPQKFENICAPGCTNPYICSDCFSQSILNENDSLLNESARIFEDYEIENKNDVSKYHSLSDLNTKLNTKTSNDLFILHLNIVSLVKNIDEIKSTIAKTKNVPDIILLTETRLHDKKLNGRKN